MHRPIVLLLTSVIVLFGPGCDLDDDLVPDPGSEVDTPEQSDPGAPDPVGPDQTPPTTSILAGPDRHNIDSTVHFEFAADEPATFECSLDDSEFAPCNSPHEYPDLAPGPHRFQVRAIDLAGNPEPSPVEWPWSDCYQMSAEITAAASVSMCSVTGNKAPRDRLLAFNDPQGDEFEHVIGWSGYDLSSLPDDFVAEQMVLHVFHQNGWANPLGDPLATVQHSTAKHWLGSVVTPDELRPDTAVTQPVDRYDTLAWNDLPIDLSAFDFRTDLAGDWITLGISDANQGYSYVIFYSDSHPVLAPYLEVEGYSCQPPTAE